MIPRTVTFSAINGFTTNNSTCIIAFIINSFIFNTRDYKEHSEISSKLCIHNLQKCILLESNIPR